MLSLYYNVFFFDIFMFDSGKEKIVSVTCVLSMYFIVVCVEYH